MKSVVLITMFAIVGGVFAFPVQMADDSSSYTYSVETSTSQQTVAPAPSSPPVPTDTAAERSDDPGRRNARNFAVMIGPGPGFGLGFPFGTLPVFGPGPFIGGPGPVAPGFFNRPLRF